MNRTGARAHTWLCTIGLGLGLGCAVGQDAAPGPTPTLSAAPTSGGAAPTRSSAKPSSAEILIHLRDLAASTLDDADTLAAARAAGLTTTALIDALRPWLADPERPTDPGVSVGLRLLAAYDEPGGLEFVTLMVLHGRSEAKPTLEQGLEGRALAALPERPCAPPDAQAIAAAHAELDDFRVLDRTRTGGLKPRTPSAAERDDLAYFMAAIRGVGAEVGEPWEDRASAKTEGLAPALAQAEADWDQALARGDLGSAYTAGLRSLELLGWPGPIRIADEPEYAWGGASHSYRMRDLAMIAEVLGAYGQARALYTRANPGGGACGTSVSSLWQGQMRGAIRSAELEGGCQATVAARLLDLDAWDSWSFGPGQPAKRRPTDGFDYGPERLTAAGFDLARLLRGAMLTRNREQPPELIAQRLVGPERRVAAARLEARGSEGWEARVYALEGLLDLAGEPGLAPTLAALPSLDDDGRVRAIDAIGKAARRTSAGPCDPEERSGAGSRSSKWYRVVLPFGRNCTTRLDDAATAKLAGELEPYLRDRDPEVRVAAADALVRMLALGSVAALRKQAAIEAKRDEHDEQAWVRESLLDAAATLEAEAAEARE